MFFLIFRRKGKEYTQLYINNTEALRRSGYAVHNETKIIIHGFANTISSLSVQSLKEGKFVTIGCFCT